MQMQGTPYDSAFESINREICQGDSKKKVGEC
jgi:hypothetical protein